jgi:hypothetical protein
MELMGVYMCGATVTTGSDLTPYDANYQPFITPLTYIAITTGNVHFLAMLGVGT